MKLATRKLSLLSILLVSMAVALSILIKPTPPVQAHNPHGQVVCPLAGSYRGGDGLGAGRGHQGYDMFQAAGSPVFAPMGGRIEHRTQSGIGAGNYIVLRASGHDFVFMHLRAFSVSNGAQVAAGTKIGEVGNSGMKNKSVSAVHLHFEVWTSWKGGSYGSPAPTDIVRGCAQPGNAPNQTPTSGGGGSQTQTGRIQGLKRGGDNILSIEREGTGTRSFVNSGSDGSFYFNNLSVPATYIVRVNPADGKSISWTACGNRVGDCHKSPDARGTGTEAKVTFSGGGYIDLWWDYTSTSTTPTSTTSNVDIIGSASGRCLDAYGRGTENGTKLNIYDCVGSSNQKWTTRSDGSIVGVGSGRCVDVVGGSTSNSARVQLWDCHGGSNQKWSVNSRGEIVNTGSGRCLDVYGQYTANSSEINIYDCVGTGNQKWSLR